jgi:hypothetical protein
MYLDVEILDIKGDRIMPPTPTLRGYPVDPAFQRLAARHRHNRRVRRAHWLLTARNRSVGRIWRSQRQLRPTERNLGPSGEVCRQA